MVACMYSAMLAAQGNAPAALAPGAVFRDCADCPEMVVIPAGQFTMGIAPGEEEREGLATEFRGRSEPRRTVTIKRFAAGKLEVTRAQYRQFAEATGRGNEGCFRWNGAEFEFEIKRGWRDPGFAQDDTHPATCISWNDASAYTQWLSQKAGKRYRLLTEAEWEYAARAGTTTARYWGDDAGGGARTCEFANSADQAARRSVPHAAQWGSANCDDGHAFTAPAGRLRANAFGLHDMLGNVAEWTQDCWNGNYQGAPRDGSAWNTGDCGMRAVRGGAWDDAPIGVRAAYRVGSPVTVRVYARGFRVARDE